MQTMRTRGDERLTYDPLRFLNPRRVQKAARSERTEIRTHSLGGWNIDAVSLPAEEFTGDFYVATQVDRTFWFAVGDFSGHGLAASISMAMIQEEFDRIVRECDSNDAVEVVASLDRNLREHFPENKFATLVVGRSTPDGRLQLVNAGHCYPVVVRSRGEFESVRSTGPMIGLLPCAQWTPVEVLLEPGDRILIYTDGLIEAMSESGEEFGVERVLSTVEATRAGGCILRALLESLASFAEKLHDDVTMFALQRA